MKFTTVVVEFFIRHPDTVDPDKITGVVESYLEHGSHRDGIDAALAGADLEGESYGYGIQDHRVEEGPE